MRDLKPSHSCGMDGITARLLKEAGPSIYPVIQHIVNLSISHKCFPDCWKIGRITPLHKEGDTTIPGNFRPISVLVNWLKDWSIIRSTAISPTTRCCQSARVGSGRATPRARVLLTSFMIFSRISMRGVPVECSSWTYEKLLMLLTIASF